MFFTFIVIFVLHIQAKVSKKNNNIIAVFSENDISDKLPNPEAVAAQIPKKMILKESIKSGSVNLKDKLAKSTNEKAIEFSSGKSIKSDKEKMKDNKVAEKIEAAESRLKNSHKTTDRKILKDKYNDSDGKEGHNRKSKSMKGQTLDEDENGYDDNYIVVETSPYVSIPLTAGSIPTATVVSATESKSADQQIAQIVAITNSDRYESTIIAQRVKQFKPRNRMEAMMAISSNADVSFNVSGLLTIASVVILLANM